MTIEQQLQELKKVGAPAVLSFDFSQSPLTERHPLGRKRTHRQTQHLASPKHRADARPCHAIAQPADGQKTTTRGIRPAVRDVPGADGRNARPGRPDRPAQGIRADWELDFSGFLIYSLSSPKSTFSASSILAATSSGRFISSRLLTPVTITALFGPAVEIEAGRQRVGYVWIDICAQFVRRDLPVNRLADRKHPFRRRRQFGWRIKPLPDERLSDLGGGQ